MTPEHEAEVYNIVNWHGRRCFTKGALFGLAAGFALGLSTSWALAQTNCGPVVQVREALANKYGESVVARGLIADQSGQIAAVMETWVNGESGSWTVLMTTPAGVSCIAASGGSYEAVEAAAPGVDG